MKLDSPPKKCSCAYWPISHSIQKKDLLSVHKLSQKRPYDCRIVCNEEKRESYTVAKQITQFLQEKNTTVVSRDDEAEELSVPPLSSIQPSSIDCLISLGGDGTILSLVHHFPT